MSISDQINNSYKPKQEPKTSTYQEVAEDIFDRACKRLIENAQKGCVKQRDGFFKSQKYVEYTELVCIPMFQEKSSGLYRLYEDGVFWCWYVPDKWSAKQLESALKNIARPEGIRVKYSEHKGTNVYIFECDIE